MKLNSILVVDAAKSMTLMRERTKQHWLRYSDDLYHNVLGGSLIGMENSQQSKASYSRPNCEYPCSALAMCAR
jgi:hypothetical protein